MHFRQSLVAFLAPSLVGAWSLPLSRRQDVGILTTFLIDDSCDKTVVERAHTDVVKLAKDALDINHDELSTMTPYKLDRDGAFTIDYFGAPNSNYAYRQHVFRTLNLLTDAYKGRGWSDWWSN